MPDCLHFTVKCYPHEKHPWETDFDRIRTLLSWFICLFIYLYCCFNIGGEEICVASLDWEFSSVGLLNGEFNWLEGQRLCGNPATSPKVTETIETHSQIVQQYQRGTLVLNSLLCVQSTTLNRTWLSSVISDCSLLLSRPSNKQTNTVDVKTSPPT